MKIKAVIGNLYQYFGLKLINFMSRFGHYALREDIAYGDKSRNKLDYYLANGDAGRPTVVFFYGGNWRSGDKRHYRFVADSLIRHGYNVIIPDYRLYPLVRFEQIQQDGITAVQWAIDNVPSEQPIFLMGHSAGAQIGALICLNKVLLDQDIVDRIKGFVGLAGPYDFYPFTEPDHWDLFSPEESYASSQAINYVRPDCPPMYLLHGENDMRVKRGHSKSLMEKLQSVGGNAAREVYSNMGHVGILLSFSPIHRRSSPVIKDVIRFLAQGLNEQAE